MSLTLENFYTRVLRKLLVVPPNGTASAEDRQRVKDSYPSCWAMLNERDLVSWNNTEDLPDWSVEPMVSIVAYNLAPVFAVKGERLLSLQREGELFQTPPSTAERQLRQMQSIPYIPNTLENEYY